jgi:hypothetical protein
MDHPELRAAEQAYESGRYTDALIGFERAVLAGADQVAATYGAGVARLALGDTGQAQAAFEAVLQRDPHHADSLFMTGYLQQKSGNPVQAAAWYRRALQVQPTHASARQKLGEVESEPASPNGAAAEPPVVPMVSTAVAVRPEGAAESLPTLAEVVDKRLGLEEPAGPAWLRCRPLRRSMIADLWPIVVVLALWLSVNRMSDSITDIDRGGLGSGVVAVLAAAVESAMRSAVPVVAIVTATWAVLRWWTTEYVIHQRRVDVTKGILYRRHQVVWLYQVNRPVGYTQNLPQMLLDTGSIVLEAGALQEDRSPAPWGRLRLAAVARTDQANEIAERLRRDAVRERRAMLASLMGQ